MYGMTDKARANEVCALTSNGISVEWVDSAKPVECAGERRVLVSTRLDRQGVALAVVSVLLAVAQS